MMKTKSFSEHEMGLIFSMYEEWIKENPDVEVICTASTIPFLVGAAWHPAVLIVTYK